MIIIIFINIVQSRDDYLKSLKNHQKGYFKMLKVNHAHDHLKKDLFQEFSIMGHVFQNFSKKIDEQDNEKKILEHLKAYQFLMCII